MPETSCAAIDLAFSVVPRYRPQKVVQALQRSSSNPPGTSHYRLAKAIGVPASRISEIITGQRAITADTDLRLCRALGLSPGYWLRAQAAHDTELASADLADELERIQHWWAAEISVEIPGEPALLTCQYKTAKTPDPAPPR